MRISDWSSDVCSSDLDSRTASSMKCLVMPILLCLAPLARADDAALQQYLDKALRANPALAAQSQNVGASDFNVDAAPAQQYPTLIFNARYTNSDGGETGGQT